MNDEDESAEDVAVVSFQPQDGEALILEAAAEKSIRYEFYRFLDHWRREFKAGRDIDQTLKIRAYRLTAKEFAKLEPFDGH